MPCVTRNGKVTPHPSWDIETGIHIVNSSFIMSTLSVESTYDKFCIYPDNCLLSYPYIKSQVEAADMPNPQL